jgi:hypothetical protein
MDDNEIEESRMGGMEEDLPDDFAIALGRLRYLSGIVEMLLSRFRVPQEPSRRAAESRGKPAE